MRTALITGITGQDGSYLAELLLEKGYRVFGLIRKTGSPDQWRIDHIKHDLELRYGDLLDDTSIKSVFQEAMPDEIYHLGAQSFVHESFRNPVLTGNITGLGAMRLLDAAHQIVPDARFYQASTSELFGKVRETPQCETTPFHPRSPYGVAKLYAYWSVVNYRESYGMFASNGILFNHESPRRGMEFVTRKVTNAVARIKLGKQNELRLGNLDARRDWGYAKEYVACMWKILQHSSPEDFVIGTGKQHSVRELVEHAFSYVGLDYEKYVHIDAANQRPAEVDTLIANPAKAEHALGWKPKTSFKQLVEMMVDADMEYEKAGRQHVIHGR